jgi:hypothetical protein
VPERVQRSGHPMNWPASNPGAGEIYGIRHLAQLRTAKAESLRGVATRIRAALRIAQSGSWSGSAQTAFVAKTEMVLPDLELLGVGLDAQAAALMRYAGILSQIQDDVRLTKSQSASANSDLLQAQRQLRSLNVSPELTVLMPSGTGRSAGLSAQRTNPADSSETAMLRARAWSHFDDASTRLRRADAALAESVSRRRTADSVCAAGLSSDQVLGRLVGVSAASVSRLSPPHVLDLMHTLSATDLTILLAQNPGLAQKFWDSPPDATLVATWWSALSLPEKAALILGAAAIIGNLGGIDYASRILANMNQLAAAKSRTDLTKSQKESIAQIEESLGGRASRGLIDLNFSVDPPLAAIAIGNMDTAQKVTWAIPGMDANTGNMRGWVDVAQNLYEGQTHIEDAISHAVVAWIGYKTPSLEKSLVSPGGVSSVWQNTLAQNGALRLAGDLNAFHQTRVFVDGVPPYISVVAHSYGTTTAAYALANIDFTVDSAVFIASAGIDKVAVPDATALHVSFVDGKQQLYSTQASADEVATIGRVPAAKVIDDLSSLGVFGVLGLVVMSPGSASDGSLDSNRLYPGSRFGAIEFGSDGEDVDAIHYNSTLGHDALGAGLPGAPVGRGYFDRATDSLRDTVLASTGHGHEIAVLVQPQIVPPVLIAPSTRPSPFSPDAKPVCIPSPFS